MLLSLIPWLGAAAIGLSLGLLGSGGSILTVPVLVYLFGQDEKAAIAGSLAVVGTVALAGALLPGGGQRTIRWDAVAWFGVPGMLGTWLGATLGGWLPGRAQLLIFAVVMLVAGTMMLRPPGRAEGTAARPPWKLGRDGLLVGMLTGLVGVGGGFAIVPALVLLGGFAVHEAVGTSLAIIALNCAVGFFRYRQILEDTGVALDWPVLIAVATAGVAGSLAGRRIGGRLPDRQLRQGFALLLFLIAAWIVYSNLTAGPVPSDHTSTKETLSMTHADPVAAARARIREIDVPAIDAAVAAGAVVIDVREPHEHADDAIPGTVNIPVGVLEIAVSDEPEDLDTEPPAELSDPSCPIYLYCRSGGRSALAAAFLQDQEFAEVYSLAGGMLAWREAHPAGS